MSVFMGGIPGGDGGGGGGATTFLQLTDTPGSYAGQTGLFARVNAGETALEFSGSLSPDPVELNFATYADMTNPATWGTLASGDYILRALGSDWNASGVGYPFIPLATGDFYSLYINLKEDATNDQLTRTAVLLADNDLQLPFTQQAASYAQSIIDRTVTFPTVWANIVFLDDDSKIYSTVNQLIIAPQSGKNFKVESQAIIQADGVIPPVISESSSVAATTFPFFQYASFNGTVVPGTFYATDATPVGSIFANVGSLAFDYLTGNLYLQRQNTGNNAWVSLNTQVQVMNNSRFSSVAEIYHVELGGVAITLTITNFSVRSQGPRKFIIKDALGLASPALPIIIKAQSPATHPIDGQSEVRIESPYGVVRLYSRGDNQDGLFSW